MMNRFFGKNNLHLNDREIDLKTPAKQSHNDNSSDEHIIAWVKFLARCAAQDDYRLYQKTHRSFDKSEHEN